MPEQKRHGFCGTGRSGLRGSALSLTTSSDGKPCSGVRGDQQVSTASYIPAPGVFVPRARAVLRGRCRFWGAAALERSIPYEKHLC